MAAAEVSTKKAGKGGTIGTIAILTLLAGGGGALVGKLVGARLRATPATAVADVGATTSPYGGDTEVRELPSIVTDLAGTPAARVRMQAAIVFPKAAVENPTILAAQVGEDMLAFLKTLTLEQLQGASGLQNLRDDLNDRASVRSQGRVREVIIETLVTQ